MDIETKFSDLSLDAIERHCETLRKEGLWLASVGKVDGPATIYLHDVPPLVAEVRRLQALISSSLPFLEEAWQACFRGQEQKMLSAEERGMGGLLAAFREIAAGNPASLPPGLITTKEASEQTAKAMQWAHKTLGDPNSLVPELQEWMSPGETCVDGLKRAVEKVRFLESLLQNEHEPAASGVVFHLNDESRSLVVTGPAGDLVEGQDLSSLCLQLNSRGG